MTGLVAAEPSCDGRCDERCDQPDHVLERLLDDAGSGRTLIPASEVVDGLLDVQQALNRWRVRDDG